jgi:hypothetical protein
LFILTGPSDSDIDGFGLVGRDKINQGELRFRTGEISDVCISGTGFMGQVLFALLSALERNKNKPNRDQRQAVTG